MPFGGKVGVDLVYIPKFEEKIRKRGRLFLDKIFSPDELEEAAGQAETLAGKFAAKEAFVKTLDGERFALNEIRVLKENHKPYLVFNNRRFDGLSISHARDYAVAMIVVASADKQTAPGE
jgi:phosphopantetheine--protein transferase-like protein